MNTPNATSTTIYFTALSLAAAVLLAGCERQRASGPESITAGGEASAPAPAPASDDAAVIFEALPPHLEYRVANTADTLAPPGADVPRGVISRLKLWPPEQTTLSVCFFRGDSALRGRIASVATRWLEQPVGVSLDFGAPPNYRSCVASGNDQIRIGFQYNGYWSLVGQDSYVNASQMEESMNFQGFLVRPPAEQEFMRVVLHEFGHALGFEHEHQHPWAQCDFNMPYIYSYLAGPPNYWSHEVVDFNMKPLAADNLVLRPVDVKSIMLYSFPVNYYLSGANSQCFSAGNYVLSTGDTQLLAEVYPVNRQQQQTAHRSLVSGYLSSIEGISTSEGARMSALTTLTKFTRRKLPSGALERIPRSHLPQELRDVQPMQ
jgi:hypothetical protein